MNRQTLIFKFCALICIDIFQFVHFVSWNFSNFVHKLNVMADFLTILSDQKEELQRVTSYAKVS
ncbi:MAG: hypothetical protein KBT49_01305, partial [Bacteroidetes bacterium]|nr:hypothetical protein [Candidatus Colenecus caballi]